MTIDDSSSALMQRVSAGDADAFGVLYDQLAPLVFGVCRRVLQDPSQAEEVTQEVFVELWRQAPRFDAQLASVRTWAAMIARRRAVDRVRSEQARRNREQGLAAGAPVLEWSSVPPDEIVVDRDLKHRAIVAMDTLSAPQREALELAFYGGYTHVEIADRLGIALGTAKTRLRDGLIRLRQVMESAS